MERGDNSDYNEFRKKRVKIFKRLIVSAMVFFIALPNVICLVLLGLVYKTNVNLNNISNELNFLKTTRVEKVESTETMSTPVSAENVDTDFVFRVLSDAEEYDGYKRIYLTFDDGPSRYTNELLDLLNEYDAKATFFVLAQEGYDDEYKRIVNEGHTLGIHSYKHVYSDVYSDLNGFKNDVDSVYDFVSDITGVNPSFYRFPGGSSNTIYKGDKDELLDFLAEKDLVYYDWNVTSNDATSGGLSKSQIANNILRGIEGKDDCVVLMHDANDKHSTIEALEIVFRSLQNDDEKVIFLPITENSEVIQHIKRSE